MPALPMPHRSPAPAPRIPLLPRRVLAAVQAMPPHMAVITVLSVSTPPVCLASGPTWDSCTAAACMAGLRPSVPMGSAGASLSRSKGQRQGKEGGMSPAAPWLSLPQMYTTAWAQGVCRRVAETLQDLEGFLSVSQAAGWPARMAVAVPDHAQRLPGHKAAQPMPSSAQCATTQGCSTSASNTRASPAQANTAPQCPGKGAGGWLLASLAETPL